MIIRMKTVNPKFIPHNDVRDISKDIFARTIGVLTPFVTRETNLTTEIRPQIGAKNYDEHRVRMAHMLLVLNLIFAVWDLAAKNA